MAMVATIGAAADNSDGADFAIVGTDETAAAMKCAFLLTCPSPCFLQCYTLIGAAGLNCLNWVSRRMSFRNVPAREP